MQYHWAELTLVEISVFLRDKLQDVRLIAV
jgi:hypothetical protein